MRYHNKVPDEPRKDVVFYEQFVGNNRVGRNGCYFEGGSGGSSSSAANSP